MTLPARPRPEGRVRVVHMTSVHSWQDVRIFAKMCRSLAAAGYEVHLVAACRDLPSPETHDGVTIHAVPPARNRRERAFRTARNVLKVAEGLSADVYHFHDPEFLFWAPAFEKRAGRPVIYDAHEDVRLDVLSKDYLPAWSRGIAAKLAGWIEDRAVRRLSGVVAATPSVGVRFAKHPRCVIVQNFPLREELAPPSGAAQERTGAVFAYVGGIAGVRGIREMIRALPAAGAEVALALAGEWTPPGLREECQQLQGWPQVKELGFVGREEVARLLHSARAGLLLFHPEPNHTNAQPTKLFEYMSAELPVIASDFPLWRSIIEGNGCGLPVNPLDPEAIAAAMRWVLEHPQEAAAMGKRGREAVLARYNWESESQVLLKLYRDVQAAFPGHRSVR